MHFLVDGVSGAVSRIDDPQPILHGQEQKLDLSHTVTFRCIPEDSPYPEKLEVKVCGEGGMSRSFEVTLVGTRALDLEVTHKTTAWPLQEVVNSLLSLGQVDRYAITVAGQDETIQITGARGTGVYPSLNARLTFEPRYYSYTSPQERFSVCGGHWAIEYRVEFGERRLAAIYLRPSVVDDPEALSALLARVKRMLAK